MPADSITNTFTGLEFDAFPDLTGLSPATRRELSGFAEAHDTILLEDIGLERFCLRDPIAIEELFSAAWSKLLATLTGEQNIFFLHWSSQGACLPIQITAESSLTSRDVVRRIRQECKDLSSRANDPSNVWNLASSADDGDLNMTGIVCCVNGPTTSSDSIGRSLGVRLDIDRLDKTFTLKLHFRRCLILSSDAPHLLAMFRDAVSSIMEDVDAPFLSWSSIKPQSSLSLSNPSPIASTREMGETVHNFVEFHARKQPRTIALDFLQPDGTRIKWTFADLDHNANVIADVLLGEFQVQPEQAIPICVPKSPTFYACILAVMKAGATFTPFANLPNERKSFMFDELDARLALYIDGEDMSWCTAAPTVNVTKVVDQSLESTATVKPSCHRPQVLGSQLVYQMYTSGSTGRPKAVNVEHRNAVETVMASRKIVPWNSSSRMLQYAAPSFDMCYFDTFLAWGLGITLCSATDSAVYNNLAKVINTLQTDLLGLTPSVANTLDPDELPCVRWLYCIGEAMPQALVDSWRKRLVNSYGPTEASQMVTLFPVDTKVKSSVIGRPFANTTFFVLQRKTSSILPILSAGELCIGGLQIARGYHANPEKTRSSFIDVAGVRLYRTGDLVRMLGSGNFEFLGRADDQVKIRGQRVELGEINQALIAAHQEISQASSQILRVSDAGNEQLVSFLVVRQGLPAEEQDRVQAAAMAHLRSTLPPYMVPNIMLTIGEIPLSASRKVDKKALTAILRKYIAQKAGDEIDLATQEWTHEARLIQQAYASVSGVPSHTITQTATIFELGIDSISAIEIASLLKSNELHLSASDILEHPSVSSLSTFIASGKSYSIPSESEESSLDFKRFDSEQRSAIVQSSGIDSSMVEAIRPCTPLQTGMIAQTVHSNTPLYFNHIRYAMPTSGRVEKLSSALDELIEKYDLLRTGFAHTEDSRFPMAMITYKVNACVKPLTILDSDQFNIVEAIEKLQKAFKSGMKSPPWMVAVNDKVMHLIAHHSLYDAKVLELWLSDLSLAYRGMAMSSSPGLETQLSKLLYLDSSSQQLSDKFWTELQASLPATKFPCLTPLKSKDTSFVGASRLCSLNLSTIEDLCKQRGITVQVAGQASWGFLLSAYVGEESVTFGTVLSGRTTETSQHVGLPCITTIPTPFQAGLSFKVAFRSLLGFNAKVQKHQFTPLKRIERLLGRTNDSLFDTIFTLQQKNEMSRSSDSFQYIDNQLVIDYPVSIELQPLDNGKLNFHLYHRLDCIPASHANLILDQLDMIFCAIINDDTGYVHPETNIANPALYSITPALEPALPSSVNLLHELFEKSAQRHPNKPAFEQVLEISETGDDVVKRSWTYAEVESEGNKIANLLIHHGIKVGSIVGICFDKCPEAAFVMLGISKAGCSFLALDPGAPQERKEFIVNDSGAAALVTKGDVLGFAASGLDIPVINLDQEIIDSVSEDYPALNRSITPNDLSYCLYTSGTTGLPKGCAVTHENVTQAMMSFQHLYKRTDSSRWLQFASYHFDVSVMEHFWTWSVGMCVVTAARDLVFADLSGTIRKLKISHIDLTPSLARILEPSELPLLAAGVFVVGGEMLRQDILDRWGPTGAIHNAYGPTEATIGVTMYPGVPAEGRPANIGRQFINVGSFVVNPKDPRKPVLRGAVGELCVSGKLVAKGYIGRPDLTAERFIVLNGERAYRTGDLVRILHDGTFDFIGRVDDQIKLRGQRLEVGEINNVIKQSDPSIIDVSTQVLRHPKQKKEQLVSFVVTEQSQKASTAKASILKGPETVKIFSQIRQICQDKLPPYMVPTHMLAISRMPLSTNNKADTKQLKSLYSELDLGDLKNLSSNSQMNTIAHEGTGEYERKIARALSLTLGIPQDQVQMSTSFFELGLDSISVIGLSRAIKAEGINNSTTKIMKNPSVSRLAAVLLGAKQITDIQNSDLVLSTKQQMKVFKQRYQVAIENTLGVSRDQIEEIAPCTALQQGIISRAIKASDGTYFNQFIFRHVSSHDVDQLQRSFKNLVKKIQILRTKFVPTEDGYAQVAFHDQPPNIKTLDVESEVPGSDEDDRLRSAHKIWASDAIAAQTFDSLFVMIIRGKTEASLSASLFHAGYDGRSLTILLECLVGEFNNTHPVTYGPNFFDLLPYGPLQAQPSARRFWTAYLKDAPQPTGALRELFPKRLGGGERDIFVSRRLNNLQNLEPCRRSLNVTHQAMFQACWNAVLQETLGRPSVIGLLLSGSAIEFDGAERVIGPTFNAVPFYVTLKPESIWKSVILECHGANIDMLPYQHTPLRDIQRWVSRRSATGPRELFQTVFVFQRQHESAEALPRPWTETSEDVRPDYPLAFEVTQIDESCVNITVAAQRGQLGQEACENLIGRFETTLQSVLANPDSPISASILIPDIRRSDPEFGAHILEKDGSSDEYEASSQDEPDDFAWDETSEAIRSEIASLAGLKHTDVSADTSILELGLDSIDAVKLSSRIRVRLGVRIAISQLMSALTVRKISTLSHKDFQQNSQPTSQTHFDSLKKHLILHLQQRAHVNAETALPCTPLQEAMIAEMIETDHKRYFNHDVMELAEDTDTTALKNAWLMVLGSNPLLHSRPVQINDPQIDTAFAFVEQQDYKVWHTMQLSEKSTFDTIFDQIRTEMLEKHGSEPPLRLTLTQIDNATRPRYLILSVSHAMYDGWSLGLMHDAVLAAYQTKKLPQAYDQSALQSTLASIIEAPESDSSFWQRTLQDAPASFLPQRLSFSEDEGSKICRLEKTAAASANGILNFCKTSHVTIAAFAQTVWSLVLASTLRQLDITYGLVLSGRDTEESQKIIFPTMNTVVARAIVHGSLEDMVRYTHHVLTTATEHQHFPLRKAARLSKQQRAEGLFNCLFMYQKRANNISGANKRIYRSVDGASDVEYPLCVEAEIIGTDFVWRLASKSDHLSADDSRKILDSLIDLTSKVLECPELEAVKFDGQFAQIASLTPFRPDEVGQIGDVQTRPITNGDDGDQNRPWSDLEKKIQLVVAQVGGLNIEDIHRNSDLLGLGLDSISLIKVSSLLRDAGVHLRVSDMIKAGCLGKMSQIARDKQYSDDVQTSGDQGSGSAPRSHSAYFAMLHDLQHLARNTPKIPKAESVLPATAGQVFMLSKWQNHDLYLSGINFRIEGVESQDTIEAAWERLTEQLPILRANYVATKRTDAPVMQLIPKAVPFSPTMSEEYGDIMDDNSSQNSDGWVLVRRSVQPVRMSIRGVAKSKWDIQLELSHAIYDGYSLHLLLDRLRLLLVSTENHYQASPMESHSKFHQRCYADAKDTESFWRDYLKDCKPSQLLTSTETSYRRSHVVRPSLAANVEGLRAVARRKAASLQALFIATWSLRYTSLLTSSKTVDEIVVGVFVAARNFEGAENLDMPTLGFVPLRIRKPLESDVLTIAKRIQKDLHEISENSRSTVGIWQLQEWVGEEFGVDTWVNIILGEGVGGSRLEDDGSEVRIIFEESREEKDSITKVHPNEKAAPDWGLWLEGNAARGTYKASVDVEATIWKDSIDVGMLSPHTLLDHEGTKRLLEQLGADLDTLAKSSRQ